MARPKQKRKKQANVEGRGVQRLVSGFSQAIEHLQFPRKDRPKLLSLPQEIQDIIFDLAYPRIDGFKYITRAEWDHREQENLKRIRQGYVKVPFPRSKACEFLISKRFSTAAAKSYISNQIFDDTVETHAGPAHRLFGGMRMTWGIAGQYTTSFITDNYVFSTMHRLPPNLKSVTLKVTGSVFDSIKTKRVWVDDLGEEDFSEVMTHCHYFRISGLQNFHLIPDYCIYADEEEEEAKWEENVRKLETFMRPIVFQKKALNIESRQGQDAGGQMALYEGSRVALTSSTLLKAGLPDIYGYFGDEPFGPNYPRSRQYASSMMLPEREKRSLRLQDIPDDLIEFEYLLATISDRVFELIRELKLKEVVRLL